MYHCGSQTHCQIRSMLLKGYEYITTDSYTVNIVTQNNLFLTVIRIIQSELE